MDDSREVIGLVDKIRGYQSRTGCEEIEIELPQIVVVGAQSSGKSSVLDGLMGSSILPRGKDTVTKCPIIVQLTNIKDAGAEGVEFPDDPKQGRIGVKDYEKARNLITKRMEESGGIIRDEPVTLKVFSPKVVTLTVVDLPGIKRLNNAGGPDDLEKPTKTLSLKYINQKNAIILAVSTANYDICNSDGIVLAKEADPNGDRTIGVLTKLDLMDKGTDARGLLTRTSKDAKLLPKLGMIGVVNRSQMDIENKLSVEDQLENEKAFLDENYPDLAAVNGVPYLRKRLHELLVQHILKCLPEIQANIEKSLEKCKQRIEDIPDMTNQIHQYRFVFDTIQVFELCMRKEILGCIRNPAYQHLYGGISIKDIFETFFTKDMDTVGQETKDLVTDDMILNAFRNSGGFDSFFVYPEAVFRKLSQEQIKHIEKPALKCAERVHDELVKIVNRVLQEQRTRVLNYFPEFRKAIKSITLKILNKKLDLLKKQIKDYIRTQASVVFLLDPGFLNKISKLRRKLEMSLHGSDLDSNQDDDYSAIGDKLQEVAETVADNTLPKVVATGVKILGKACMSSGKNFSSTNNESMFAKLKKPSTIKLIKEMVSLYFNHIKKEIKTFVPKLVADRLIVQFSSEEEGNLGTELKVHVMQNYEELIRLSPHITQRQYEDVKLIDHLNEIILEIKEVRNANFVYKDYNDENGYAKPGNGSSAGEDEGSIDEDEGKRDDDVDEGKGDDDVDEGKT